VHTPLALLQSEKAAAEVLSMPLFPELTDDQIQRVTTALTSLATCDSTVRRIVKTVNVDGNQAGEVLVAIRIRNSKLGTQSPGSGSSYVCTVELAPASRILAKFLSLSSFRNELGTGLELLT
jgi:hypothetical protein